MNSTALSRDVQPTMSSLELLDIINESRAEHGQGPIRSNDFHARVRDELEGEYYETFVKPSGKTGGRPATAYRLNRDQCMLVSMRESKAVRRYFARRSDHERFEALEPPDPEDKPPDHIKPTHMTLWCWPYRDSSEREKWRLYDDAKNWRWRQEWAEVPILEDYREFCCRVCRELEL